MTLPYVSLYYIQFAISKWLLCKVSYFSKQALHPQFVWQRIFILQFDIPSHLAVICVSPVILLSRNQEIKPVFPNKYIKTRTFNMLFNMKAFLFWMGHWKQLFLKIYPFSCLGKCPACYLTLFNCEWLNSSADDWLCNMLESVFTHVQMFEWTGLVGGRFNSLIFTCWWVAAFLCFWPWTSNLLGQGGDPLYHNPYFLFTLQSDICKKVCPSM